MAKPSYPNIDCGRHPRSSPCVSSSPAFVQMQREEKGAPWGVGYAEQWVRGGLASEGRTPPRVEKRPREPEGLECKTEPWTPLLIRQVPPTVQSSASRARASGTRQGMPRPRSQEPAFPPAGLCPSDATTLTS